MSEVVRVVLNALTYPPLYGGLIIGNLTTGVLYRYIENKKTRNRSGPRRSELTHFWDNVPSFFASMAVGGVAAIISTELIHDIREEGGRRLLVFSAPLLFYLSLTPGIIVARGPLFCS